MSELELYLVFVLVLLESLVPHLPDSIADHSTAQSK